MSSIGRLFRHDNRSSRSSYVNIFIEGDMRNTRFAQVSAFLYIFLSGCSVSYDNIIGKSRSDVTRSLGEPSFEFNFSSVNSCYGPKPGLVNRCRWFDRSGFEKLPEGVPIDILEFKNGEIGRYVYPTTARTTIIGSTAYTTVWEGGERATDTRCTAEIAFINNVAVATHLDGNGCKNGYMPM